MKSSVIGITILFILTAECSANKTSTDNIATMMMMMMLMIVVSGAIVVIGIIASGGHHYYP